MKTIQQRRLFFFNIAIPVVSRDILFEFVFRWKKVLLSEDVNMKCNIWNETIFSFRKYFTIVYTQGSNLDIMIHIIT